MILEKFDAEDFIYSFREAFAYIAQEPDRYTVFASKLASKVFLDGRKDESIGRFIGKIEKRIKLIQTIQIIPVSPVNKGEIAVRKMFSAVSLIRKVSLGFHQ